MNQTLTVNWKAVLLIALAVLALVVPLLLFDLEVVLSLGAFALAVSALAVSWWSFRETRKHNRSSVMPYLDFFKVRGQHESFPCAGIWLTNYGTEVARLDQLIVHVDDQPAESMHQALDAMGLVGSGDLNLQYCGDLGKFLGPGERLALLYVDMDPFTPQHAAKLEKVFARLHLHLEYRSIYDKRGEAKM